MRHFKINFWLVIAVFWVGNISAQGDCKTYLLKAIRSYEQGNYIETSQLLETGLSECKFNKREKLEVYKLLATAYYEQDEIEKGDVVMYRFLRKNPEYSINSSVDPYEFVRAYEKFKIIEKLSLSFRLGQCLTFPKVSRTYAVLNGGDYDNKYKTENSLQFEFLANYNFGKYFLLSFGANYAGRSFSRVIPLYDGLQTEYTERYRTIILPIIAGCKLSLKNGFIFTPYVGVYYARHSDITYNSKIVDSQNIFNLSKTIPEFENITLMSKRNEDPYGWLAGINFAMKFERYQFFLDVRKSVDLEQANIKKERYNDPKLLLYNYYVDDDFGIETLELSVGVRFALNYTIKNKYTKTIRR